MTRRALWVVPVSNLAGASRHVLDAVKEGIPGFEITVAAPEGPLLGELERLGVPHRAVAFDGSTVTIARGLRAVIKEVRPAVVHTHLAKADFVATIALLGVPPKLVSTEHGIARDAQLYNRGKLKSTARRVFHHGRSRRFDALIAVSESTREEMLRAWRPTTAITVIRNGVDRPSLPAAQPGSRFLSLSRLAPEKRISEAIHAFAAVAGQRPDAILTVAGEGPEREALGALARDLGIADQVSFPGHLDPALALDAHDVLVQLSAWENASYSILDAVVHGLGVVATPVGGNPEILPPRCLSEADDEARVERLLLEQADDVAQRPTLPESWPTVSEMASEIALVYERILR